VQQFFASGLPAAVCLCTAGTAYVSLTPCALCAVRFVLAVGGTTQRLLLSSSQGGQKTSALRSMRRRSSASETWQVSLLHRKLHAQYVLLK
jgi:hypothetical protein